MIAHRFRGRLWIWLVPLACICAALCALDVVMYFVAGRHWWSIVAAAICAAAAGFNLMLAVKSAMEGR